MIIRIGSQHEWIMTMTAIKLDLLLPGEFRATRKTAASRNERDKITYQAIVIFKADYDTSEASKSTDQLSAYYRSASSHRRHRVKSMKKARLKNANEVSWPFEISKFPSNRTLFNVEPVELVALKVRESRTARLNRIEVTE